jgi:hypothetical protein
MPYRKANAHALSRSLSHTHTFACTCMQAHTSTRKRARAHTHTQKCSMPCCIHNWMMWSITTQIIVQSNMTTKFFQWCVSWFHHLSTENNVAFIAEIPQYLWETCYRIKRITIFLNLITQLRRHFTTLEYIKKCDRSIRQFYSKT